MGGGEAKLTGPDLKTEGAPMSDVADGAMLLGHAEGEAIVVARRGDRLFAVGATCTHYGGPLAEGVLEGDVIRCPWHHACFDLNSGDACAAPALSPIAAYDVQRRGDRLFVLGKKPNSSPRTIAEPRSVVVVGGGAAGFAAIEMLRRRGHTGAITLVSADANAPYDRPNASKDYLAGSAPEEWMPLRGDDWYGENKIDLRLATRVEAIDVAGKSVRAAGTTIRWDALVLATGAEAIRLPIPGADRSHVHVLRSLADSRAIIAHAKESKRAVVVGASFIALEAAAALCTRGLEVHVVAPDEHPLARVVGAEIGEVVRKVHASKGVVFHLRKKPISIEERTVTLDDGAKLDADLVVMGVGVRPSTSLAESAGLRVERGIVVDSALRTSATGVWAAGDVARYDDRRFGSVRIEHWVVAERQGQRIAENILAEHSGGEVRAFDAVPYFWSNHFDVGLGYVGHAERWDRIDVDGDLDAHDFAAAFRQSDRTLAVVTMGRDRLCLQAEVAFEHDDEATLRSLVPPRKSG